jgi:thiamine biosynthesis protein ThiI
MERKTYVIHFDEICLKLGNRSFFEDVLASNIKAMFKKMGGGRMKAFRDRILVDFPADFDVAEIESRLGRISGICDFSPIQLVPATMEAMKECALLQAEGFKGSFRITANRSDKNFPFTSPELGRIIGEAVFEKYNLPVDLKNPDHVIRVQVHRDDAYVYGRKIEGMGGLPVGSSAKLISLLSGGIDSPVASFKMFSRGCTVVLLHFHNYHDDGSDVREKVLGLAKILSEYQPLTKLYMVPFLDLQQALISYIPSEMRMVAYRRMMFRVAACVRRREKARGYITGDSVGQVASQTMENLSAIHAVADAPILSPLIGDCKKAIIALARKIGTYEQSILPYSDCCSYLVDRHPDTAIRESEIQALEESIPMDELINRVLPTTELYRLSYGELIEKKQPFKRAVEG